MNDRTTLCSASDLLNQKDLTVSGAIKFAGASSAIKAVGTVAKKVFGKGGKIQAFIAKGGLKTLGRGAARTAGDVAVWSAADALIGKAGDALAKAKEEKDSPGKKKREKKNGQQPTKKQAQNQGLGKQGAEMSLFTALVETQKTAAADENIQKIAGAQENQQDDWMNNVAKVAMYFAHQGRTLADKVFRIEKLAASGVEVQQQAEEQQATIGPLTQAAFVVETAAGNLPVE